jgi:hypothetical protein
VLNGVLFEQVLAWAVEQRGEESMREARRSFEAATGPILEGARDYEQRIGHFWEQQLCTGESCPVAAYAAGHAELGANERRQLAGWLRSHRSLFEFEEHTASGAVVRDRVLGGRYLFRPGEHDQKLASGDCFDARLVPIGDVLWLSPFRVYHPPEARPALGALLERVDRTALAHGELLDALLLMRSRYLQFESVRVEHVYHERALSPVRLRLRPAPK